MKITVYTKYGCPQCDMTKNFLTGEGIEYELINVEDNEEAMDYVRYELGVASMPVVEKGDYIVVGFNPDKLLRLKSE